MLYSREIQTKGQTRKKNNAINIKLDSHTRDNVFGFNANAMNEGNLVKSFLNVRSGVAKISLQIRKPLCSRSGNKIETDTSHEMFLAIVIQILRRDSYVIVSVNVTV